MTNLKFGTDLGAEAPHRTHVDAINEARADAPAPTAPAPEAPKRGRPAKYATKEERNAARRERDRARRAAKAGKAPTAPATATKGTDGPDLFAEELKALKEGYEAAPAAKEAPAPEAAPEAAKEEPPLMGYVLLSLVEALAPLAVRWIMRRDTEGLSLTKAERERLEPLADRAAATLLANADPVQLFAGAVFAIYAAKAPALPKLPPKARKATKTKGRG